MAKYLLMDELMLTSAVRYALGRSTYIVSATTDQVKKVWSELSENSKAVILRDVKEAVDSPGTVGMQMDHQEWVNLYRFMTEN